MRVVIQNLTKQFGETTALKNLSLEIQSQELFFLLGPSGCGKTTLLRLVAGFYQPDEGELFFGDKPMKGIPPHQRNTGMVFQNYALWPHMTVAENVAYGLEVRSVRASEKKQRVAEALAIVQMEKYAERRPNQLSGGQQQRVALARALVIKPDVLLLDEPLSNLDANLREEMRFEIRRLHETFGNTTLYVTHDQGEAMVISDRIAVLKAGKVAQAGTADDLYHRPRTRFVAEFIGRTNVLDGVAVARDTVAHGHLRLRVATADLEPGARVALSIRPHQLRLGEPGAAADGANAFRGTVRRAAFLGDSVDYEIAVADSDLVLRAAAAPTPRFEVGAAVGLRIEPAACVPLAESDPR